MRETVWDWKKGCPTTPTEHRSAPLSVTFCCPMGRGIPVTEKQRFPQQIPLGWLSRITGQIPSWYSRVQLPTILSSMCHVNA